jgi:hypothetical protein
MALSNHLTSRHITPLNNVNYGNIRIYWINTHRHHHLIVQTFKSILFIYFVWTLCLVMRLSPLQLLH